MGLRGRLVTFASKKRMQKQVSHSNKEVHLFNMTCLGNIEGGEGTHSKLLETPTTTTHLQEEYYLQELEDQESLKQKKNRNQLHQQHYNGECTQSVTLKFYVKKHNCPTSIRQQEFVQHLQRNLKHQILSQTYSFVSMFKHNGVQSILNEEKPS